MTSGETADVFCREAQDFLHCCAKFLFLLSTRHSFSASIKASRLFMRYSKKGPESSIQNNKFRFQVVGLCTSDNSRTFLPQTSSIKIAFFLTKSQAHNKFSSRINCLAFSS